MVHRALAVLAAAFLAVAGLALPGAGPAAAVGTCTLIPPARIAIYGQIVSGSVTVRGDCIPRGTGTWLLDDAYGGIAGSGDGERGFFEIAERRDDFGPQRWEPQVAILDLACEDVPPTEPQDCIHLTQNRPFSEIRLGGYASLTGVRSGLRIYVTAGSGGWSPYSHKLVPRPRLPGEIQTQYADGTWHRVGAPFTTGADAEATVTVTTPATRAFRYAIYPTPSYFEAASTPIIR